MHFPFSQLSWTSKGTDCDSCSWQSWESFYDSMSIFSCGTFVSVHDCLFTHYDYLINDEHMWRDFHVSSDTESDFSSLSEFSVADEAETTVKKRFGVLRRIKSIGKVLTSCFRCEL
jgi:hypothetical protein